MKILREKFKYFDYYLFVPYFLLCIIGIIMVYSASSITILYSAIQSPDSYMLKQLLFTIIGIIALLISSHLKQRIWANSFFLKCGYIGMVTLLVVVLAIGKQINGARGWLNLGFFSLQPSEVCKLYLAIYTAHLCATKQRNQLNMLDQHDLTLKDLRPYAAIAFLLGLVLVAPDTGGFLINFMIVFMIFLASSKSKVKMVGCLVSIPVIYVALLAFLKRFNPFSILPGYSYAYSRIQSYFDPFKYVTETGKQVVNSYYAISNGGLLGVGLGNSIQKRGYLPEAHTDFILAIIAEELGVVGVFVVLFLLCWLIMRIFLIGIRSKNSFNALFCYGIGTFFLVETLLNVGGVCGLLPITGVTLPFISYGGSSMLVLSTALGLVLGISVKQKRHMEIDVLEKKKKLS